MKKIKKLISPLTKSWDFFWFQPVDTFSLSCFRFFFSTVLLIMYVIRFFDIRLFFYNSGLMSSTSANAIHTLTDISTFNFIFSTDVLLYTFYLAFIIILVLMIVGVGNRLLTIMAFVLHLVFLQRNPSIIYAPDIITTFWLFYLILSSPYNELKWLHYFINKQKGLVSSKINEGNWLHTIALRFLQIHLCVISFFSGITKLTNQSWWDGTFLSRTLYSNNIMDLSFTLSVPLVLEVFTTSIVLFELYFPILIWIPKTRKLVLNTGVILHILIALFLSEYFFSIIMISSYILFISPNTLKKFVRRFTNSK